MNSERRRMLMGQGGYTVNWNQIFSPQPSTSAGVTATFSDGVFTVSGTLTDRFYSGCLGGNLDTQNGNKYYFKVKVLQMPDDGQAVTIGGFNTYRSSSVSAIGNYANITTLTISSVSEVVGLQRYNTYTTYPTLTGLRCSYWVIDLTTMFGSGNEPSTVAQFETWLTENGIDPDNYIPYNAGETRRMLKPSWL